MSAASLDVLQFREVSTTLFQLFYKQSNKGPFPPMRHFINSLTSTPSLLIFTTSLFLLLLGLSSQEFIGFESRFIVFLKEMLQTGPSFFPTTYYQPYPDYPATATIIIYFFTNLFGTINKTTVLLPTALTAAAIMVMTYKIGALQSKRLGFIAVGFLLFTTAFIRESRTISMDQYISLITVSCFYLAYSASLLKTPQRLYLIPFLIMASFLIRGPIGVVIPTGVLCSFYLLNGDFKKLLTIGSFGALCLFIGGKLLLLAAYHDGGENFVQQVIGMQVTERLGDISLFSLAYYFISSLGDYAFIYPIALVVTLVLFKALCQRSLSPQHALLRFCIFWALTILVGLSIATTKRYHYLLSMAPALALISAYLFEPTTNKSLLVVKKSVLVLCQWALPITLLIAALMVAIYPHEALASISSLTLLDIGILLLIAPVLARRYRLDKEMVAFVIGIAAFFSIHVLLVEPVNQQLNQSYALVQEIEQKRAVMHAGLGFFQLEPDALPIKYMAQLEKPVRPIFMHQESELFAAPTPMIFITKASAWKRLPEETKRRLVVMKQDDLGHAPVVIFCVEACSQVTT